MNRYKEQFKKLLEFSLPWLVLIILLTYTYAKFFQHSYGFSWDPNGNVDRVFVTQKEPAIILGDHLVQVGPLRWDTFHADLRATFFDGPKPGQVVPIILERNGQPVTIQWVLPSINQGELNDQLFSEWPLAYFFWLTGTLTFLFLRPKDERWWLLATFNFLTAIWLEAGGGASNFHIWYSALVLRMAIWLCVPVYLHLHWLFPRPLGKLPPLLVGSSYVIAIGLMIAQWFQLLPGSLYFVGFLIAILGSLILLVVHAIYQPDTRRELRLLLLAVFFILIPVIILAVIQTYSNTSSRVGSLALLSFPLLPLTYLYATYRRQLGGLEIRVNQLMSSYFFVILLGMVGLPLLSLLDLFVTHENFIIVVSLTTLLATVLSIWGYPTFQNFVERRWLGITLPSKNLPETYSARIITSTALPGLLKLLEEEVFPSLLVRQYAIVQTANPSAKIVLSKNVTLDRVPKEAVMELLASPGMKRLIPLSGSGQPLDWVRVILPLQLGSDTLGAWLLGRRDPDDLYPQAELPILQSLANQTAIAMSNIMQTERLRRMYENDVERNEKDRIQLALDLHDSVLNQLAILRLSVDETHVSPNFQKAYDEVASRLREIVTDLRPPMLGYGLKLALEGLADNLMERSDDKVNVIADIQTEGDARYAENIEQQLFRIVQQACENALRHSRATQIKLSAKLTREQIWLLVEDNGIGLPISGHIEPDDLLADKHFGLVGMIERARLIGAEVEINSFPEDGTRIQITWAAVKN